MIMPPMMLVDGESIAQAPTDIDLANAAAIGEHLAATVPRDVTTLNLDLSRTRYLDSAGIDMLLMLDDRLRRRRQKLRLLVTPASPIRRLLQVTGLDQTLQIHARADGTQADSGGVDGPPN